MSRYRRSLVAGGTFFFTVTLADRRSTLLVTEIDRLRRAYAATAKHLPFETLAICVLPDHLHALWTLPLDDADYPRCWSLIKAAFSRGLPAAESRSDSKRVKRDKGIWQRRYWEHQIRDTAHLQRHCDYIHYNPVKHGLVSRVQDWPHSSFHRQVREGDLALDWARVQSSMAILASEICRRGTSAWAGKRMRAHARARRGSKAQAKHQGHSACTRGNSRTISQT